MRTLRQREFFTAVLLLVVLAAGILAAADIHAARYTLSNRGSAHDGATRVGRFYVAGRPAFCCDHRKTTPATGTKLTAYTAKDADIAKVLYYGSGGPAEWKGFRSRDSAVVATSLALDHYFNGNSSSNSSYRSFMRYLRTKGTSESGSSYILYRSGNSSHQRLAAVIAKKRVTVDVSKVSADSGLVSGNENYSLWGADYGVYAGGKLVDEIRTDSSGKASCTVSVSAGAASDITVKELDPSRGYTIDSRKYKADGRSGKVSVRSVEMPVCEPVEIVLHKKDSETGKSSPQKGASLEGAVFRVDFTGTGIPAERSAAPSEDKASRTWYFMTDSEGRIRWDRKYLAEGYRQSDFFYDPADKDRIVLPLGRVEIKEEKAPEGYLLNRKVYSFFIEGDGKKAHADSYQVPEVPDEIKRGDIEFVKISGGSAERMSGIPFRITALQEGGRDSKDGESHIVVTDENGYVSTADSFNPHSHDTNANDRLWKGAQTEEKDLDKEAGIWFGDKGSPDPDKGALPYGEYRIDELPCRENAGYKLLKGIEIKVSRDGHVIKGGTLTNEKVRIGTEASFTGTDGGKTSVPAKAESITDRVSYSGLEAGQEYILEGVLMDKDTGKPIIINGQKVISVKRFIPESADGKTDIRFDIDAEKLRGKTLVVFEKLMKEGIVTAKHEDLDDSGQTVRILNLDIGTSAEEGRYGGKYAAASEKTVIRDRISFSGLEKGRRYLIRGVLMDSGTGKPAEAGGRRITAEKTFTAQSSSGSVDVVFRFDASGLQGKSLVAFEKLYSEGSLIAEHSDIDDKGQTVHIKDESYHAAQTGDDTPALVMAGLTVISTAAAAAVYAAGRKKSHE